ncbi:MAG: pseudouridine synthase [Candidatus Dependentiae bacterium]
MKNKKNNTSANEFTLNKFLAHAGVASRRKTVEIIKKNLVKVNGKVINDPSYKVHENDQITIDGDLITIEEKKYLLLNKPTKIISTVSDEKGRATVVDVIGDYAKELRLYPVGRLDYETTGLLLLTNDGQLAHQLAHPRFEIKKIYHVTLDKPVQLKHLELIKKGVMLEDGKVVVDNITHVSGKPMNHVHITLHSGKYRIVRRLFEALGFVVHKLDRINYAGLTKRGLPIGAWRNLRKEEVKKLYLLASKKIKK